MLRRWQRRLRYWVRSHERARLLREEMEIHFKMMVQDLMEDGMTESEARGAARRRFGNPTLQQEDSRQTWIARWVNDLIQDAVFALRTLRKQPSFAAVAVISAALGIGACSMIFGIANFALFRQLRVEDPSRLMSISPKNLRSGKAGQSMSYPELEDLRQGRSFQGIAAYFQFMPAVISGGGEPQRYWGSVATANYFEVVRPAFVLGRGFDATRDDRKGESPVVVLSYQLWRSRFGSDRMIVGRSIELNRRKVIVIGVTGPGFRGTETMFFSDFWLPFSMLDALAEVGVGGDRLRDRGSQWLMSVGRLRAGVNGEAAASEVNVIGERLRAAYSVTNKDRVFRVERAGQLNPGIRKMAAMFFLMLLVVAILLLGTACANIANLLLARASARQKEIATRLAIGAGRSRLVRQLLTESAMLALLGGAAGYAVAHLGAGAIGRSRIPLSLPIDLSVSLDYRVMLFSMALSALTGVVFGLVPALRATRPDLTVALKGEGSPIGQLRRFGFGNLLVVAQVAICMALLICSGLFLRSYHSARNMDTGLANRNVLLMAFDPSLNRNSPSDTRRIVNTMLEGVRALPGVESASVSSSVPLDLEGTQNSFVPEGRIANRDKNLIRADIYSVAPQFFETLGIRIVDGEDYRPGVPSEDIVIVNQAAADSAFGKENPVGRRISYLGRTARIVGLVETTKSRTIGEDPHPCLYFPIARDLRGNESLTGMTLLFRTRGDPAGYTRLALQTIRNIAPDLALFDVRTMDTQVSRALFLPRVAALLFGFAGLTGLLIATIGIYGLISFTVARRSREISVRMALGATRLQVLGMVLKQGITLTAVGSAIGLSLAVVLSRTAASLLYGVSSTDAMTFIAVPSFLLTIALVACGVPARRAASLDPNRALRCD
jgi:predicted permease